MTPILFLCSELQRGGAERQWTQLVPALRERELEPLVLTLRDTGPFYDELAAAGIPVACAYLRSRFDIGGLRRAFALAGRPALVVSQGINALVVGEAIATRARVAHVTIEHAASGLSRRRHRRLLTRFVSRSVERVVAVGESQAAELKRRGYSADQITLIRNGVPHLAPSRPRHQVRAELGLAADGVAVLLVATLRAEKNVPLFLAAVEGAAVQEPGIRGFIAGGGPLLRPIRELAGESGPTTVLGERDDVPDLLAAADIVCLTSDAEAMPMVLLEASSLGRPLVATDVGGNREVVVNGETGLLVAPGDLGGLAGALLRLTRDPELRRAMGERALARHEDLFTLERMVDGYRSLIERELKAKQ